MSPCTAGMDRRTFLSTVGAAMLAAPLAAEAQVAAGKVYQLGILSLGAMMPQDLRGTTWWRPFLEELRELSYVQGRNLTIRYEGADAKSDLLPLLAANIVKANPDIIVTTGPRETRAAMAATSSVPIVMTLVSDPV